MKIMMNNHGNDDEQSWNIRGINMELILEKNKCGKLCGPMK
jgi:hypothetical protein